MTCGLGCLQGVISIGWIVPAQIVRGIGLLETAALRTFEVCERPTHAEHSFSRGVNQPARASANEARAVA